TNLFGANGWVPAWAPNGLLMTFQTVRDRQADIYRMTNEGAEALRMTEQSDRLGSTDWSPDGGWIAFMSGRSGYANLYVMDRDAQHTFRLTDETNENYDPDWRPVFEPLPAVCKVRTEFEQFARVRVGPGENRGVFGWLPAQQDFTVIGQALDEQGKTWWQLDKDEIPGSEFAASLWVAEEEVDEIGNCLNVPPGEIPPIIPGGPPPVIVTPGGGWGPCGSCDTCGGPASECVLAPDGACLWDPATCAPPTTGECYTLTTQVILGIRCGDASIEFGQSPNCDGQWLPGSSVTLTVPPYSSGQCRFVGWSGSCPGASGSSTTITVTMSYSCTAIATYTR
ncbi:MAG: PD40 domain-containing protein, partial [Chloroflexota bacterium]